MRAGEELLAYTIGMSTASGKKRKTLAIIDGKSIFYRGYYAMPNLSTKDGLPTGGVFGFATMALELLKKLHPDYVCVAWDKPKTNIRKRLEMYPKYKAGRKPAPPDFYEQIPLLHELLEAFGWPVYELDDYEADDIMGALAMQARDKDIETMLITSDLDALQLINGHVHVYALKRGFSNIELFRPETFIFKYGITPEQFLDLKSLKGDSSDNIPGVPGIGEKTALDLLKQYESLDNIYKHLDEIKESVRNKLAAGKDSAYLSKDLARIWIDAPIKLNLKEIDGRHVNPARIAELLQKFEFRTLVRQLPQVMRVEESSIPKGTFNHDKEHKTTVIDSPADAIKLQKLSGNNVYLQSRSAGKYGRDPRYFLLSDGKSNFVLDVKSCGEDVARTALKGAINNKNIVGYDTKLTIKAAKHLGVEIKSIAHDVLVGAFLLNPLRREQSLTELASADLDYEGPELYDLSDQELIERCGQLLAVVRSLYENQEEELKKMPKLHTLAKDIEWPVIPVLADMEYEGIKLDTAYLDKMNDQLTDQISDIEQHIYGIADAQFNIASPQQLAEVLFTKLQLPTAGIKKGKTGYSTAASELDKLRGQHPVIDLITQFREYTKLKNTYVDTLPTMVDERSRVHTTFNLTIAQTGRLSSTDPNLQNIPVRTDLGKKIRTAFIAEEGNVLVSADYSQFELRLAAYLADDKKLIKMFNEGVDVHTVTAAQVYGREPEDVTKQMRRDAKVINFGVLYGMSPHGLSIATGMTQHAAKSFIDKYFELRKPLLDYIKELKDKAHNEGFVETLFGRRRPTPDVRSSNFVVRQAAERAAVNMPIQGTEADLMKMAMVAVAKQLDDDCKMLLQIHDSLIIECPKNKTKKVENLLRSTMENIYKLPVKLDVDVSSGKNWGDLH